MVEDMQNIVKWYQDLRNKNEVVGLRDDEGLLMRELENKIKGRCEQLKSIIDRASLRALPVPNVCLSQYLELNGLLNRSSLVR